MIVAASLLAHAAPPQLLVLAAQGHVLELGPGNHAISASHGHDGRYLVVRNTTRGAFAATLYTAEGKVVTGPRIFGEQFDKGGAAVATTPGGYLVAAPLKGAMRLFPIGADGRAGKACDIGEKTGARLADLAFRADGKGLVVWRQKKADGKDRYDLVTLDAKDPCGTVSEPVPLYSGTTATSPPSLSVSDDGAFRFAGSLSISPPASTGVVARLDVTGKVEQNTLVGAGHRPEVAGGPAPVVVLRRNDGAWLEFGGDLKTRLTDVDMARPVIERVAAGYLVAWEDNRHVWVQLFGADGQPRSERVWVNEPGVAVRRPYIDLVGEREARITWERAANPRSYGRRITW